jgi:hypothetical protein
VSELSGKEKGAMKKLIPAPRGGGPLQEIFEKTVNRTPKMVWMVDLKKAGDRAECLWSKNQKKGPY